MVARQRLVSTFWIFALGLGVGIFPASNTPVFAANESPQGITVQGRLFEPTGNAPLSEIVDIKFTIYARTGATTECLLYEELHENVDLSQADGVFALEVGSPPGSSRRVTPGRDPNLSMAQVFANGGTQVRADDAGSTNTCPGGYTPAAGDARRLRITVVRNGSQEVVLTPDQVINSVPQTQVAQTLQGSGPDEFVQIGGLITLSNLDTLLNGSDASALHHHDSLYLASGGSGNKDLGSGITSTLNGTLGIGTAAPSARVEVRTANASGVGLVVQRSTSQTANLVEIRNEAGSALLVIDPSGQVVLPNSTPSLATHAASKGYVDAQLATRESPLSFSAPLLRTGDTVAVGTVSGVSDGVLTAADYLRFGKGEKLQDRAVSSSAPSSGAVLTWNGAEWAPQVLAQSQWTSAGGDIYFGAGTSSVGINTATPSEQLHVVGSALVDGNIQVAGTGQWIGYSEDASLSYQSGASTLQLKVPESNALALVWKQSGSDVEKFRFTSTGRIGAGTAAPTAALHLPASTTAASSAPIKLEQGALMTTPEAGAIEFDGSSLYYTNSAGGRQQLASTLPGTPSFPTLSAGDITATTLEVTDDDFAVATNELVVAGGNVGIGTATPATQLDVLGVSRFRNPALSSSYFDLGDDLGSGMQSFKHTSADGDFRVIASKGHSSAPCTVFGQSASGPVGCGGVTGQMAITQSGLALEGVAIGGYSSTVGAQSLLIGTPTSQPETGFGDTGIVDLGTRANTGSRPALRYTASTHEFRTNAGTGSTNPGTSVMAVTGTGVGVGTSTPDTALQVVGAAVHFDNAGASSLRVRDTSSGNGVQAIEFVRGSTTQASLSNDASDRLSLETQATDILFKTGSSSERLRVQASSGNVGIGTSNPASRLHVSDSMASFNTVEALLNIDRLSSGTAQSGIGVGVNLRTQADDGSLVNAGAIEAALSTVTAGAEQSQMVFKTLTAGASTEQMRLTHQGRLGLGTASPQSRLDVAGSARVFDPTATTGSTTLSIRAGAGQSTTELLALQNSAGTTTGKVSATQLEFTQAGSVKFSDAAALVGDASTIMTMAGPGPHSSGLGLQSTYAISFSPGGTTEKARIDENGRLGLGDAASAPLALVHVKGSSGTVLRIEDGNQAAGRFLGTDASGNASWQSLPAASGGTVTTVSASSPLSVTNPNTTPNITLAQATTTAAGYLSSADWNTFNNKQRSGNYIVDAAQDLSTNLGSYDGNPASLTFGQVDVTVVGIQGNPVAVTAPTLNQVLKWDGTQWLPSADAQGVSQWTTSGANIYYTAGNVGIGTATPTEQLTLTGNLELDASSIIYASGSPYIHAPGAKSFFAGSAAGASAGAGNGLNTGVGHHSLTLVTTGESNTALGESTLQDLVTGSDNTAVGASALLLGTGSSNTAVGSGALASVLTGDQNTALGHDAGTSVTGSRNVFLGYSAGSSWTGDDRLFIANSSSKNLVVGDFAADSGNGRVGIGLGSATTVAATLHVDGSVRLKIGTPVSGQVLTTDADGDATWASPQYTGTVTTVSAQAGTPLSITNGTSTPVINIAQATTSTAGYLSSADWNTFNNKQSAGNYVTALAGDATSSNFNAGTVTVTLASTAVTPGTYPKVTVDQKGRVTGGASLARADIPAPLGDVIGTYGATVVDAIQGMPVSSTVAPADNDLLQWDTTAGEWVPTAVPIGQWNGSGSNIYFGAGYTALGLGTSTPTSQLHLTGDLEIGPTQSSSEGVIKQDALSVFHTYDYTANRSNLFVGYSAGNFGGRGSGNTGIGSNSLEAYDTGSSNTAVGQSTLAVVDTGSNNTAVGFEAGKKLNGGNDNSFFGYQAGFSADSGSKNSSFGSLALTAVTSGTDNVAIGKSAADSLTTATKNTAIGVEALQAATTTSNNTALGWRAGYSSQGGGNVFIGYQAGLNANASNELYIANNSTSTLIYGDFASQEVGIRTTNPGAALQVGSSGDGTAALANAWNTFSDQRLKRDFSRMEDGLEGILRLSGYRYYWKGGNDPSRQVGVIAQEVEKIFPEVVTRNSQGILTVAYDKLVAPLIESVKSLFGRIEALDERVARLEAENTELRLRLKKIEDSLQSTGRAPASTPASRKSRPADGPSR